MKRLAVLVLIAVLIPALCVMAKNNSTIQGKNGNKAGNAAKADDQKSNRNSGQGKQKAAGNQDVIINVKQGSSGGHNRNFPSQKKQQPAKQQAAGNKPSYGKLQWTTNNQAKQRVQKGQAQQFTAPVKQDNRNVQKNKTINKNTAVNNVRISTGKAAGVAHLNPAKRAEIKVKLKKLGVKTQPGYIMNRAEVIHTDRKHSRITFPKTGFDKRPIKAAAISPRHFNDSVVRTSMSLIVSVSFQNTFLKFYSTEKKPGHYYWHNGRNFNYCHYIDRIGYHWYGWYVGSKYFWTRYFKNRWWWYDGDFGRWCFWNNGFWWWQDPYHIGDLYFYNDIEYIPVNSAEDNVAVAVPDNASMRTYVNPDDTRVVKVVADTQDAFLYDASSQPEFAPVYLASGVRDVMFSDPGSGKPLEIILKLNDGSFDMFDGYGNAYNAAQE